MTNPRSTFMNRRKFLSYALSAGGVLIAAELLSTKSYFLPPTSGWHTYTVDYETLEDNLYLLDTERSMYFAIGQ